jgi:HK97 family phage portal protein
MGALFSRLSAVSAPAGPPQVQAQSLIAQHIAAFLSGGDVGLIGSSVPPELALTLSHVYCAVSTITDDFGTMTCQTFEDLGGDTKQRVSYSAPGIGVLARKLRWQPNTWQTAKAFWSTLAWQYLLRPAAYAEIIYRPGLVGFVDQIVPRHPDRVRQEVLPNGRLRFRLDGEPGGARYVTQDEMFVVRNTSTDGLNAISRVAYGHTALASAMSLQAFTTNYFKKGATAALIATYKGEKDEDDEQALHTSITRYMSGAENAGGVLLVPDDIDVKALGVEPEKAQLLGLKNLSGRDIARLFKMPPSWLGIDGAQSYGSQVQDATNYVNRCQVPMVVEFEQAIQRDLILAQDRYFAKFNMDYLLRVDLLARAQAYEVLIRSRVLRPSEARVREDYSPDPSLDRLSEGDFRPGTSPTVAPNQKAQADGVESASERHHLKAMLALHDSAVRVVRRERVAVERLAKKHANDVSAWRDGLREFYTEHAAFVAQTMRVSIDTARAYCAQHGHQFETTGVVIIDGEAGASWEMVEADELAALALSDRREAA